jgi:4,5-dihydroxyphthalate decarboxylase
MALQPRSIAAISRVDALNGEREYASSLLSSTEHPMPNLKLTLACWDYDRTRPLMDGRVTPEGIDLDIEILRPRQAFQRMLDKKEFQVCELSLASYTALKGRGDCPFVALPVALSKIFRHSCIYVRRDAGITTPQDLKGKRVGTSQWSSTGLVFMRGMLQHDYGIMAQDMHWFMGGLNSFVEPPLIPLDLPQDIRLDFLSGQQTLERMFAAGELDALLSLYIPKLFLEHSPNIARLFPNYKAAEQDYYRRTRIFPIMHTVVLREDVYRAHPWAARSIYEAFVQARDLAVDGLYDTDALRVALPWLIDHIEEAWRIFGRDFWAYGLEPNRPTFEAVGRYVHEQGLSPRVVSADELFAAGVE